MYLHWGAKYGRKLKMKTEKSGTSSLINHLRYRSRGSLERPLLKRHERVETIEEQAKRVGEGTLLRRILNERSATRPYPPLEYAPSTDPLMAPNLEQSESEQSESEQSELKKLEREQTKGDSLLKSKEAERKSQPKIKIKFPFNGLARFNPTEPFARAYQFKDLKTLVQCLEGTNIKKQVAAARALTNLAANHAENQKAIAEAGAILLLVGLLKSEKTVEQAARALTYLAANQVDIRKAIAKAGAIPLLVDLLKSKKTVEQAARALESLEYLKVTSLTEFLDFSKALAEEKAKHSLVAQPQVSLVA